MLYRINEPAIVRTNVISISITHPDRCLLSADFHYFWGWHVSLFNDTTHCQWCFQDGVEKYPFADRETKINPRLQIPFNTRVAMRGNYFYLCGVSHLPYNPDPTSAYMKRNFHMAVQYAKGEIATAGTNGGHKVSITDARLLPIDGKYARERYAHLGPKFVECRNFQFGVQYYCIPGAKQEAAPQSNIHLLFD